MSIAVAIDGPVGAGKSSIAKECAKRLGFIYVDTGAMYRCIGLNGYDVSDEIRLPEISMAASKVSAIPAVRAFLLQLQRDMAQSRDVIMDGRDIGTVVLPNATVKIYLTADAEVRAKRRYDELIAKGTAVSYESVLTDLKQRDRNDMTREIAPLKQADDAVLADTTELDFEGSCDLLVRIIKEKAEIR